jgi:hypothetical protein
MLWRCPRCNSSQLTLGQAGLTSNVYDGTLVVLLDFRCRSLTCGEYVTLRITSSVGDVVHAEWTWDTPAPAPEPAVATLVSTSADPFDQAVDILREIYCNGSGSSIAPIKRLLRRYGVPKVADIPRDQGPYLLAFARGLRDLEQAETGILS